MSKILIDRMKEEIDVKLLVSIYDTERNPKAKLRREMLVRVLPSKILYVNIS